MYMNNLGSRFFYVGFVVACALVAGSSAQAQAPSCSDPRYEEILTAQLVRNGVFESFEKPDKSVSKKFPLEKKTTTVTLGGKSKAIKYDRYRALQSAGPSKGTVIFLCGGPGMPCTGDGRPENLPPDVDVIVFDYLGLGENGGRNTPPELMTIETQGDVAAGIAKNLRLKDFVIYGTSFGTAVGTVAASKLTNDPSAPKPKFVVLDSVLGNVDSLNPPKAAKRIGERAWEMMSENDRDRFKQAYAKIEKKVPPEALGGVDRSLLRPMSGGPKTAARVLKMFSESTLVPPKKLKGRPPRDPHEPKMLSQKQMLDFVHQWRVAGCEVDPRTFPSGDDRQFGGVVPVGRSKSRAHLCECPLSRETFDSKKYQIKDTPVLYANADMDLTTPIESARYHQETQTSTQQKHFLLTKDGGHAELSTRTPECMSGFWYGALAGDFSAVATESDRLASGACRPETGAPAPKAAAGAR
jgi:pimeloyl-ACP methyl ester carboxylesterase